MDVGRRYSELPELVKAGLACQRYDVGTQK